MSESGKGGLEISSNKTEINVMSDRYTKVHADGKILSNVNKFCNIAKTITTGGKYTKGMSVCTGV